MNGKSEALPEHCDVAVIGGGPAGTTLAHKLARAGQSVVLLERGHHPRFAVGESLLPGTWPVWRDLGLLPRFEKAGFLRKYGAYFCFQDGRAPEFFLFPDAAGATAPHAYGVPRAEFDALLWQAACEAGAVGASGCEVRSVRFAGERATGVRVRRQDGSEVEIAARLVADCSGRATLVASQLGQRERDPRLDTVALMTHYADVLRSSDDGEGTIAVIATDTGWMWLIPFAGGRASLGAVVSRAWYQERRRAGVDREAIWSELLAAVPAAALRLRGARRSRPVELWADFQYRARRFAGDGWVLVGDAAAFLDPVFSSGVHLAMVGADVAADAALAALEAGRPPRARDFRAYERHTRRGLGLFSRFITAWYEPAFRNVFIRPPHGRPGVERLRREVVAVLAGDVFHPWRRRVPVEILLWLSRLERRRLDAAR